MAQHALGLLKCRESRSVSAPLGFLQRRRLLSPCLELLMAPVREVVHVLKELLPGHDPWRGVGGHEVWATAALRVGADLLAHVLADRSELVLELRAAPQVLRGARLLAARVLHVERPIGSGGKHREECKLHCRYPAVRDGGGQGIAVWRICRIRDAMLVFARP